MNSIACAFIHHTSLAAWNRGIDTLTRKKELGGREKESLIKTVHRAEILHRGIGIFGVCRCVCGTDVDTGVSSQGCRWHSRQGASSI